MPAQLVVYRLEPKPGSRLIQTPAASRVLGASFFNGAVALWVLLQDLEQGKDPQVETHEIRLILAGEGIDIPHPAEAYLGTCVPPSGSALHAFEVNRPVPEALAELLASMAAATDVMIGGYGVSLNSRLSRLEALDLALELAKLQKQVGALAREVNSEPSFDQLAGRIETIDGMRVRLGDDVQALRRRVDELERRSSS